MGSFAFGGFSGSVVQIIHHRVIPERQSEIGVDNLAVERIQKAAAQGQDYFTAIGGF